MAELGCLSAPTAPDEIDDMVREWQQDHPEVDREALACFVRLKRLSRDLEMCTGAVLRRHKLTVGEFDVLAALRRSGPSCTSIPSKLSEMLMLSRAGMTNRLDRLEAAGLAERRLDPADRRSFQIALTERGRQVIDAALAEHAQIINRINAVLPPDQRQCLDLALRALLGVFQIAEHARRPSTNRAAAR
ncbi:MAG: MarR family transcriptional regulator [Frankia sp.]|nr:MarR family transcriptional regulator [Frankia sp.]